LGFCRDSFSLVTAVFSFTAVVFGFAASSTVGAIYAAPRYFKFNLGATILCAMLLKF